MNKISVTVGEGDYTSTLLPAVARAVIQIEARTSKLEYCMYTSISIRDTHVLFKEIEDGAKMYTEEVDKMKKAGFTDQDIARLEEVYKLDRRSWNQHSTGFGESDT